MVGNSVAIWTGVGGLTISCSRRPFRTAYLPFRPQVQPAHRTVIQALHAWTVLSAFYLRGLCSSKCITVLRAGCIGCKYTALRQNRQVVNEWLSRIRMEQSVDVLSLKAGAILWFFLMGWHMGGKIQSGWAHRKSYVPQHKWDDIKRALQKCLYNSSLFYK